MSQIEMRFSGSGGQGLNLSASIFSAALLGTGKSVAQSQSYEPTSRGGLSRADIVVSDGTSDYPLVTGLDYLVILDACAIEVSQGLIRDSAVVLVDALKVPHTPTGKFTL
ncbi:MAG: 2-oxoacid:acceptor oxidoreductase family protein, partial [Hyphomicrobiales bacterium]